MPNVYGLVISFSILVCVLLLRSLVEKKEEDTLWGIAFWAILCGIVGARVYHVLDYSSYYLENPLEIFKIWNGGLGIWGALTGGFIGALVYVKKKKENTLYWLDLLSVVLPLGQAIGRWGNFFNQEIFGKPTNLPWGLYVKPENRPMDFVNYSKFHPLFIYESFLNLILFTFLFTLYKKFRGKLPNGVFLLMYLGGYSIIRFFLEFLRIDPWTIYNLNVSQCISILVLSFSIVFILHKKNLKSSLKRTETKMVYISSDHRGFELKNYLVAELSLKGVEIVDLGPTKLDVNDDYPDYAGLVAKKIQENSSNRGILICANGVGVSIAANKFKGVRAALSWNPKHAESSRTDDNSNILVLPADYVTKEEALEIVERWIITVFSGEERHVRRLKKLEKLEEK